MSISNIDGTQEAVEQVVSSRFIPNDLTKGLVSMGLAIVFVGFAAVKFSSHNQAMLDEARELISEDFNSAIDRAAGGGKKAS